MNIYAYGGPDRQSATLEVSSGNEELEAMKTYSIDATKGMLLIVYPKSDTNTDFEFKYWVGPYSGNTVGIIIGVVIFIIFISVGFIVIRGRMKKVVEGRS